jgi:FKBP-type peptidyl-prolyl cis-trans isomerase SlyD
MRITTHKVVTMDYTLTDEAGRVIDSSEGRDPFSYIHGTGSLIRGVESALDGKSPGDSFKVTISPKQGYGERDESLVEAIPRKMFQSDRDLEPGMRFQTSSDPGALVVTVVRIEDDTVTVDGNHPLAGVTLIFAIAVRNVREATAEELSHGHIHSGGTHED